MDAMTATSIPSNPKEMKSAISKMIAGIGEPQEQIKADDVDIKRINAEYAALKLETRSLRDETESSLKNLWSIL